MVDFYDDLVRAGLAELADRQFQDSVWAGQDTRVSSFVEAFHSTFTDSNLTSALAREAYGEPIDALLRDLEMKSIQLGFDASYVEIENDSRLQEIRQQADQILVRLKERPLGTRTGARLRD